MERLGGEDVGERVSIAQVATASFVGSAIEWYDFFLYGTAAALVFPALFFPGFSELAGTPGLRDVPDRLGRGATR